MEACRGDDSMVGCRHAQVCKHEPPTTHRHEYTCTNVNALMHIHTRACLHTSAGCADGGRAGSRAGGPAGYAGRVQIPEGGHAPLQGGVCCAAWLPSPPHNRMPHNRMPHNRMHHRLTTEHARCAACLAYGSQKHACCPSRLTYGSQQNARCAGRLTSRQPSSADL